VSVVFVVVDTCSWFSFVSFDIFVSFVV